MIRAGGDHTRPADAREVDAVPPFAHRGNGGRREVARGKRRRHRRRGRRGGASRPAPDPPLPRGRHHRDEGRAVALQTRVVLVAGGVVDATLLAELRRHGYDREAVALHRAVAAAFAHRLVDEDAPRGILEEALLPEPSRLRRAPLVVHDDGDPRGVTKPLLHLGQAVAPVDLDPAGPACVASVAGRGPWRTRRPWPRPRPRAPGSPPGTSGVRSHPGPGDPADPRCPYARLGWD